MLVLLLSILTWKIETNYNIKFAEMIFNYGKYVVWSPSYMRLLEIIKIQMLHNKNSRNNIFSFEMLTYFKILSVKHLEFEYFVLLFHMLRG